MSFGHALDGVIYALDPKTGQVTWTVNNAAPMLDQIMTRAPLVVQDKVITCACDAACGAARARLDQRPQHRHRQQGVARLQHGP
jgi:outer membrane protein assembly factor BamB